MDVFVFFIIHTIFHAMKKSWVNHFFGLNLFKFQSYLHLIPAAEVFNAGHTA